MKVFIKILAMTLALILVFCLNSVILTDIFFSESLYGSYTAKMDRANSLDGNKFIIIGGSASNLGFDSKKFEELSGLPAVNLSISAGIPLCIYFKAAEICAKPGDIIILPLEYSYYNMDFLSIDEAYVDMVSLDPDLKCRTGFLDSIEFGYTSFLRSFTRLNDCFIFSVKNLLQTKNTIYIADSVDEYGDFCLHQNRPAAYSRTVSANNFTYKAEFFEEISRFIEAMEEKGISVYFTYPCHDFGAIKNSDKFYSDVQAAVQAHIPSENIIGTPFDFAFDRDFFFDTAYHIKYESRQHYTQILYDCYQKTVNP